MTATQQNLTYSRELGDLLQLQCEPVAIKMVTDDAQVPDSAIRPMRDFKKHMALCQAFTMARRDGKTIYMEKGDHWCWNPLIGLGHVDCPEGSESFNVICSVLGIVDPEASRAFFAKFPRFALHSYKGILVAPLSDCPVEPDIVMVYVNNARLRTLVWAVKNKTGKLVETQLDAIDSCVYCIVTPMLTGEYRVTLPDMGEYERAMAGEDEVIFSIPWRRMEDLLPMLRSMHGYGMGYKPPQHAQEMELDFKRPPFYNTLFEMWGLDKGENWDFK
jgi:uncharacterized protein (DUF169 family)